MLWFRHIKRQLAWLVSSHVGTIVVAVPSDSKGDTTRRVQRVTEWMLLQGYEVAQTADVGDEVNLTFQPASKHAVAR